MRNREFKNQIRENYFAQLLPVTNKRPSKKKSPLHIFAALRIKTFYRNVVHFSLANGLDQVLLKDAKPLSETRRNSLLLLCYSLVFSELFGLDKNRALSRAKLNKRQATQPRCLRAGTRVWAGARVAKPRRGSRSHVNAKRHLTLDPAQNQRQMLEPARTLETDTKAACSDTRDRSQSLLAGYGNSIHTEKDLTLTGQ